MYVALNFFPCPNISYLQQFLAKEVRSKTLFSLVTLQKIDGDFLIINIRTEDFSHCAKLQTEQLQLEFLKPHFWETCQRFLNRAVINMFEVRGWLICFCASV